MRGTIVTLGVSLALCFDHLKRRKYFLKKEIRESNFLKFHARGCEEKKFCFDSFSDLGNFSFHFFGYFKFLCIGDNVKYHISKILSIL